VFVSALGPGAVGGQFIGGGPNYGYALSTRGPIEFLNTSGTATVHAGDHFVVVNARVPTDAMILAVMNSDPGIGNHAQVQFAVRLSATQFQIQMSAAPANSVKVGWFVLG